VTLPYVRVRFCYVIFCLTNANKINITKGTIKYIENLTIIIIIIYKIFNGIFIKKNMNKILFILFSMLFIHPNLHGQSLNPLKTLTSSDGKYLIKKTQQTSTENRVINTIIWGTGGVDAANAEFSLPFVNATSYSPGDNITSWTALSINESGGSVAPGAAYWERSMLGYSQGAYNSNNTTVSSPSSANGVAIFDSDFLDNGGVAGAFGSGQSPSAHKGELISPRIDLTGYTDIPLTVNFFSFFRKFRTDELSVSLSTDDGSTWTTNDYLNNSDLTEEFINTIFLNTTAGVSNLSQCRIKFTFDGDYYFAIVDDVSIFPAPAYDLGIAAMDQTPNSNNDKFGDQIHLTGSRYFPVSQLSSDFRHLAMGANIVNFGFATVNIADNPRLIVNIEKNVSGAWQSVYTTTIASTNVVYPISAYATSPSTNVTSVLSDISWVETGDFRVTYTAVFDGIDSDMTNNSIEHFFTLTPDDYVSMVDKDVNGNPTADGNTFPGNSPQGITSWEYGSIFYFNDATSQNLKVESINFIYYLRSNFTGASNQTMYGKIYRVNNSNDFQTGNITLIGLGIVNLTGLGSTIPLNTYQVASMTNIYDATTGNSMGPLTDGHYFICIETNPSLNGGTATFQSQDVPFIGRSVAKNYALNTTFGTQNEIVSNAVVSITDYQGSKQYYTNGFGSDIIPSIGVELSSNTLSTEEFASLDNFKVYPNPTKEKVSIDFKEINSSIDVKINDIAGRLIKTAKYNNQRLITLEMPKTKGVYFLQITNEKGFTVTHKVIVE
jgi:hypothetical protein